MTKRARSIGWVLGFTLALAERSGRADDLAPLTARRLAFDVGLTGVGSAGENGGAVAAGVHYRAGRYFETSLDLAYGLLDGAHGPEDRWWAIPSVALVVPVGRLALDAGVGLGFGTVSGYDSWSAYFAAPFTPRWHLTEPEVRAHGGIFVPLTARTDLSVRAEIASILTTPQDPGDTLSYGVSVGVRTWVF